MKNKSSNTNINKLHIMKALKVKFKDVVSATNIISDHGILDNNLFQTASNYWLITGKENVIEKEINRYFGIFGVQYEIEEIQES
ncbi:hypothetical protein KBA27_06795 [bacterium]|nr:hypothetical protein [bacterium]